MNKSGYFGPALLETLHHQFGHRYSSTILVASEQKVCTDTITMMAPEYFCDHCIESLPPKPSRVNEHTDNATTLPSPSNLHIHPEQGNDGRDHNQDTDEAQISGFQDLNLNFPEYHTQEGCKRPEDSTLQMIQTINK
jgi:hypothetical protein